MADSDSSVRTTAAPSDRERASHPRSDDAAHSINTGSSQQPDGRTLMPSLLAPHLLCPACHHQLLAPTTLHCGHTVCARHVRAPPSPSHESSPLLVPSCPLPSCDPELHAAYLAARSEPNIPSGSRVSYRPAPVTADSHARIKVPSPRIDITVSKLLSLLARFEDEPMEQTFAPQHDELASDEDPDDNLYSDIDHSRPISPHSSASPSSLRPSTPTDGHPILPLSSPPRQRKRRRRGDLSHASTFAPTSSHHDDERTRWDRFEKELTAELTCEICFMLFYRPVTTPCQHTFCAKCLQRSLDHSICCPLCRQELPGFSYFQDHAHNSVILSIILQAFPLVYRERGDAIEAEERDARLNTPIFVCQLSFPGMPTFLHFFEPRYRLMLRRCLEKPNPRFGMIMPPRQTGGTEYGTMLEIRSVQMLPDGRSMVETWGVHRFRILEKGTLDGYMVGRTEIVEDYAEELDIEGPADAVPPPAPPSTLPSWFTSSTGIGVTTAVTVAAIPHPRVPSNEEMMARCHEFLDQLRQGAAPWIVQRLNNTVGPMPVDPAQFSFWIALILPIDEHEKAKLLPIKSARLRLRLVVHWIEQLNSNWLLHLRMLQRVRLLVILSVVVGVIAVSMSSM